MEIAMTIDNPAPANQPREEVPDQSTAAPPTGEEWRHAFRDRMKDQLGLRGIVSGT
jgi:hypothetical protein